FHSSGIYVIETMNLSLRLITRTLPKELESIKFEKEKDFSLFKIDKLEKTRQYERWIRSNSIDSPIKLNQNKIEKLKNIYEVEYESVLIFSKEMVMGQENIPKTIINVFTEQEFIDSLQSKKTIYNDFQLSKIYNEIKKNLV
ncbi:MAG: hypothetical protein Q7I99_05340, partial [Acholeplasmataceae bacterium]|nr:hypothetical protein [Acholeplasmataceae bacterium]